jgi:DNA-binding MarR family transcriptional regulator
MVSSRVVIRGDFPADRRRVMLTLTVQGQRLLEKARRGTQGRLAEILAELAPGEQEAVHQVMQLLQGLFSPVVARQPVPER